ncbi:MAG TPA: gluconate 2-dehydrogenase subunit 3 family protein [Burkholderiales bacterium]|nr:gluconate 2-dehydrogenase subunit 3 family protein [Burkholderiales bacterium]
MDESGASGKGRRRFLKSVGALSASVPAAALGQQHSHGAAKGEKYMFLSAAEVAFLDAAVARLIPADELGPGAKEAGVAYFIDQQLFGGFGTMAKMYRQGPHAEGTPQQGYQSPLTPQEVYRAAIAEVDAGCVKQHGRPFAKLEAKQQDEVLRALDEGKFPLEAVPARFFFNLLLDNTIEGFFSDPIYGGNRDKIGWKLVGFPGVAAVYTQHIEKYGVPYDALPISIVDILEGKSVLDETGHPKHVLLVRKD